MLRSSRVGRPPSGAVSAFRLIQAVGEAAEVERVIADEAGGVVRWNRNADLASADALGLKLPAGRCSQVSELEPEILTIRVGRRNVGLALFVDNCRHGCWSRIPHDGRQSEGAPTMRRPFLSLSVVRPRGGG